MASHRIPTIVRRRLCVASLLLVGPIPVSADAALRVGVGVADITPPAGTPSAGYGARAGRGMEGTHDPLEARAMIVANDEKTVVFVGVDNLGFDYDLVQEVTQRAHATAGLAAAEVYVGSSHTHAGGGAFVPQASLTILFGKYDPDRRAAYIAGTAKAISAAAAAMRPAKLGVGYGRAEGLNAYRGDWPPNVETNAVVTVLKAVTLDDRPIGVLFVYAAHPTVLSASNLRFSADFVGYARRHAEQRIGGNVTAIYFNGAQADVSPRAPRVEGGAFARCDAMGKALADVIADVYAKTPTAAELKIETRKATYTKPFRPSSRTFQAGQGDHTSEMNAIVLGGAHALLTVPGELSCIIDADIQRFAGWLGYEHCTILGLTNDAVGYIVTRESWRHQTYESTVSFFGPGFGPFVEELAYELLHRLERPDAYHGSRRPVRQPVQ